MKTPAKKIVDQLLEARNDDMRFDLEARIEVWVTEDDLRLDRRFDSIVASAKSDKEKKAALLQVAVDIVNTRLARAEGDGTPLEITADVSPASVNIDRLNWAELLHPEKDELEDEP